MRRLRRALALKEMKQHYIYSPSLIGGTYLLFIPVFGLIYWLNPSFWNEPLTFIQSMYFSVITITTLGYGDITPSTEISRTLTALEALSGIILIGLFLNAVAHSRTESQEIKRHKIIQEHLASQYEIFRRNVVDICLRAEADGYNIDRTLLKTLVKMHEFRMHYNENNKDSWYAVLNGLQGDKDLLEDLYVEIDLLVQQVNYALNNIQINNDEALQFLTRFSQYTYRLRNTEVYSHDPIKYVGGFLWDIMAGYSIIDGYRDEDIVEKSIGQL